MSYSSPCATQESPSRRIRTLTRNVICRVMVSLQVKFIVSERQLWVGNHSAQRCLFLKLLTLIKARGNKNEKSTGELRLRPITAMRFLASCGDSISCEGVGQCLEGRK